MKLIKTKIEDKNSTVINKKFLLKIILIKIIILKSIV